MFGQHARAEAERIEWLKARKRVLDAALNYIRPPITPRDFPMPPPTSLTVYRMSEEPTP